MNIIQHIKQHAPIVEVIAHECELKKAGPRWLGLCCFHKETTPSLTVDVEKGFFHCFGCGASGDQIKFIQKLHGLSFIDACKKLIEDCHIPPPQRIYKNSIRSQIKQLEADGKRPEAKELMREL